MGIKLSMILNYQISRGNIQYYSFIHWILHLYAQQNCMLFQEKLAVFEEKNTQVIGCSVDSKHTHFAWLNTPAEKGGIQGITYPLVADLTKSIAIDYDVLKEDEGVSYRGLFLIDKEGIIRHQLVNDLPLGRNVDEAIRLVDALQFHEENGEVCPANWNKGDKSMKADVEGVQAYFQDVKVLEKG